MNWVRKLFISLGVAFFAVCCGAVLLFNWHALGWQALSVPTGSMRPSMPPGSLVLVHSVPASTLEVGDVITYANLQKPGTTITHRIVKAYKLDGKVPAFRTKGDANPSADPFVVVGGQVRGEAVWHAPFLGRVMMWSKTWTGIAALVYLPALLIMVEEVRRLSDYWGKFVPYFSPEYLGDQPPKSRRRLAATLVAAGIVAASGLIAVPVQALLTSNMVSLANNQITVAKKHKHQCTNTNNSTSVTVTNTNNQSGSSGNVNSSGSTTDGDSQSGNVSNSNSSSTTITATNC